MATEEQRAAAYRAQMLARARARAERCAALAGDPVARAALSEAWKPPFLARLEGAAGVFDIPDDDGPCAGLLGN